MICKVLPVCGKEDVLHGLHGSLKNGRNIDPELIEPICWHIDGSK